MRMMFGLLLKLLLWSGLLFLWSRLLKTRTLELLKLELPKLFPFWTCSYGAIYCFWSSGVWSRHVGLIDISAQLAIPMAWKSITLWH
jgi:hypothetical protein